jgi:hypothetical protein
MGLQALRSLFAVPCAARTANARPLQGTSLAHLPGDTLGG